MLRIVLNINIKLTNCQLTYFEYLHPYIAEKPVISTTMKQRFLFILMVTFFGSYAQSQIVNIPDANFKNALVNDLVVDTNDDGTPDADVDTNDDGEIQVSEAEAVLKLYVREKGIANMEGIQSFINLTRLSASFNEFSSIDVSQCTQLQNLSVAQGDLTGLDLSANTNLEVLGCNSNSISSLVIGNLPNLRWINAGQNPISSLDITQVPALTNLDISNMSLSSIDVTQNPLLDRFLISSNNLNSIDVSQNPELIFFQCGGNNLSSLDISQNLVLESFDCGNNNLSNLDVSQNIALTSLSFGFNSISSIDLSQNVNLERLNCFVNNLNALDVTLHPNLELIQCSVNQLTSIDLSQNPLLRQIQLAENNLQSMDLSNNPLLVNVYIYENSLEELNIANGANQNLENMFVYDNPNLLCIEVDDVVYANEKQCDLPGVDGWCKDETAEYSLSCGLGTDEFIQSSVLLVPNPASDVVLVRSQLPLELLRLVNAGGRMVSETKNTNRINVANLTSGIYFLQVVSNTAVSTIKLIVE